MSLMTPGEWFVKIVGPNYSDFVLQPLDERLAFNAILSVHHFWDRVYHYWALTDSSKLMGVKDEVDFLKLLIKKHGDEIEVLNDAAQCAEAPLPDEA